METRFFEQLVKRIGESIEAKYMGTGGLWSSQLRYGGVFLVFSLGAFIARSTMWIGEKFGATTMEAIVFHYQHALVGTPPSYIKSFTLLTLDSLALGACALVLYWLLDTFIQGGAKKLLWLCGWLGLLCSVAFFSARLDVVPYLLGTYTKNTFIQDNYVTLNPKEAVFPEKKRNMIVLSLESMEDTFSRKTLFESSLIPRLEAMQDANPHCVLYEGKNLNWTVASLTGFLFGLPLSTPTQNQYKSADNTFLPGAVSLLELLEENGYAILFMLSGKAEFSGSKNIFTNHAPSAQVRGWEYFESHNVPVQGEWGMRDKDLYEQAQTALKELAQQEKPFFMILQTLDTHSYAVSYGDYPKPYKDDRDSFIAADHMAFEFIEWLQQQDFYDNTTVLIQGDHLYMREKLGTVFLPANRLIYNVFLNLPTKVMPSITSQADSALAHKGSQRVVSPELDLQENKRHETHNPKNHDLSKGQQGSALARNETNMREATMLDMGVSLLEGVGVNLPHGALGLGRSIFRPEPTLVEQLGVEELAKALSGQSEFYNSLFFTKAEGATPQ